MLQVRKSRFCGIAVIFFQCCFFEWNTSINDSFRFWVFFLGILFWKGALFFNGRCFIFKQRLHPMEASVLMGGGVSWGFPPCPPLWETLAALVCKKVQPNSSLEPLFEYNQDQRTPTNQGSLWPEILWGFRLVLEGKTVKEIPEPPRLEFWWRQHLWAIE